MNGHDHGIEELKARVNCATVLERQPPVWRLDAAESTRRSLKYRRGAGEIVIVNHDGRGWWDPLSPAKGDVFSLVRHLDAGLDFRAARRLLHSFSGIAPEFPAALRVRRRNPPAVPLTERWQRRPPVTPNSHAWRYLTAGRGLPAVILRAACAADALREGPQGSAWFAHRDGAGKFTGIEMRGPAWRTFSAGGDKTLFQFPGGNGPLPRMAVCESAIDALSLAALEGPCADTLYAATAGGMGPATVAALQQLLEMLANDPAGLLDAPIALWITACERANVCC